MVDICGFCVSASVASALVASDCVLSVPSAVLSTALSSAFPASDVSLTTSTPFRLAASFILSPIYSFPMSAPAIMIHKTKSTHNKIFNFLFFIVLLICYIMMLGSKGILPLTLFKTTTLLEYQPCAHLLPSGLLSHMWKDDTVQTYQTPPRQEHSETV